MDQLILQVGDRFGRSAELARSQGDNLTVGRSYENDVVVTDPYVDPRQLDFFRSPEGWKVKLVQETNPVLLNGRAVDTSGADVKSGDKIIIGRTRLRVYAGEHGVEPTRKMLLSSRFDHGQSHPVFALSMLVFAAAADLLSEFQSLTTEPVWKDLFIGSLWLSLIILFWAGGWALAGRLLRHQPNFSAQIGFTALLMGFLYILLPVGGYVEYATNSELSGRVALWGLMLIVLTALLRVNLSFATNVKHYTLAAFITASALLLATYATRQFNKDEFSYKPEYSEVLKPPFALLSGTREMPDYVDAFARAFEEADVMALEE